MPSVIQMLPRLWWSLSNEVILKYKKDYKATAKVGEFAFPTKVYGDFALPAGEYNALRIQLGEGDGANWWCVMFPPLCFVDATHGTIPNNMKKKLKKVLSEDEYNLLASNKKISVEFKFKIAELFQGSKIKLASIISKILNKKQI